ncbi:MAG: LOG family protein [Proteobacteria bacterium]|nr:LOG family protein [Pseudomonadota bacterium]
MNKAEGGALKAYKNEAFIESREARVLRILAEYMEPEARFRKFQVRDTIVFFGSARAIPRDVAARELEAARDGGKDVEAAERRCQLSRYYEDARELAHRLTLWSKGLKGSDRRFVVCTGGGPGIMEAANRGASEAKGLNIGLAISIPVEEFLNPYVTRQLAFEFHYFFMRKFWFAYLAKAVITMPGGFGTFDELFELLTLIQTLKMKKHLPIVLFGREFWRRVIDFEAMAEFGTIDLDDRKLFHLTDSVDEAFDFVTAELAEHALEAAGSSL